MHLRVGSLALSACLMLPSMVSGAEEKVRADGTIIGEEENEFQRQRVGTEMADLAAGLGARMTRFCARVKPKTESPHLALVLDSSTATCRLLAELDRNMTILFKSGPRNMRVSVMAMRQTFAVVAPPTEDVKDLRRAVRQVLEESKNSQIRAKLQLNPAQRHQIQAWDTLLFITPDDCVKDWCGGVRQCLKEVEKDYPIDGLAVITLDNADTENDIEGLAAELKANKTVFLACAPDTLLTCSDPMPPAKRMKFYESCKKQLNLNYGENFFFHRRESALNELLPVSGTNGPAECVGNPTGFGFYGLSRVAYVTGGAYFILADNQKPQCACLFHGPGDRFTGGNAAGVPIKPGPPPGFKVKGDNEKFCTPIKPYEFDPDNQKKYEPCLLAREEVCQIYQSSPFYQYLFSLYGHNGFAWRNFFTPANALNPWSVWSWGEGEYPYGAFLVTPWLEGGAKKKNDGTFCEELDPLRIYTEWRHPPVPWRLPYPAQTWGPGSYAHFYNGKHIEEIKTWLDGAIKSVDAGIAGVRANIPAGKPEKWDRRALCEIQFFILCLENQLFYLRQYRNALDELVKDPSVVATFKENENEDDLKKRLEEAKKNQAGNPNWRGVPYIAVVMPRLLKQRCEDFAQVMDRRPLIYPGGEGRGGLDRFMKAKEEICRKLGVSTWTNFYELGWQRQYHWERIEPSGPGTTPVHRQPVPPSYEGPPTAGGPSY